MSTARALVTAAVGLPLAAGFLTAVLASELAATTVAQSAATGCGTALGSPPAPDSTIEELGAAQAADAVAGRPALAHATGARAVAVLDTLFRLDNWRDLDRAAVADWVANPTGEPPAGAALIPQSDQPPASSAASSTDLAEDYLTRCRRILDSLTPEEQSQLLAPPFSIPEPTATSADLHTVVSAALGTTPQRDLAALVTAAIGADGTEPSDLLWCGPRVPPAAIAPGDLVFFDFGSAGPHHLAVALDATTVATTANLDGRSPHTAALRAAPMPTGNVVIVRPADSKDQPA